MPLRTQHPAHKRRPHCDEPIVHGPHKERSKTGERERRYEADSAEHKQSVMRRRELRKHVRALKHASLVAPPGIELYLGWKQARRLEAERAQRYAEHERAERKRFIVRRRSLEYYHTWVARLARYVVRRLHRGKRLSTRTISAIARAGIQLAV